MKVRLLVVVNVYHPDYAGGGTVFTDLCRSLVTRGFEVTVVAPVPFFPEWRDKSGRNGLRIWKYDDEGALVHRVGLVIPSKPSSLVARLLFEASFLVSTLRLLFSRRVRECDVILAFCPFASCVAFASVVKRLSGAPVWLSVQDISADAAAAAGIAGGRASARLLQRIEQRLFNTADVWSTISPIMAERLDGLRTRAQPLHVLPNWVGESLALEIRRQPAKLGRPRATPLHLLYSGNVGRKQNLLAFCQSLAASEMPFQFRIFCDGAESASLRQWIASVGDARFTCHSLVSEPEFAAQLAWTDYYVITESPGVGGSFVPSKLITGLMSTSPLLVVSDDSSPLGHEIREAQAGLWLPWVDLRHLPARLAAVTDTEFEQWQHAAARRATFFDRARLIGELSDGLHALARTHASA